MRIEDIKKEDLKFFVEKGEPGFNPERNKQIIENSIKKYERTVAQKRAEHRDELAERVDALVQYFCSPKFISNPINHYFGKRWIAYLRGEQALDRIKGKRLEMDTQKLYLDIINGKKKGQSPKKGL
jgi:hypothetical protein